MSRTPSENRAAARRQVQDAARAQHIIECAKASALAAYRGYTLQSVADRNCFQVGILENEVRKLCQEIAILIEADSQDEDEEYAADVASVELNDDEYALEKRREDRG
jgi:hypothetical protein